MKIRKMNLPAQELKKKLNRKKPLMNEVVLSGFIGADLDGGGAGGGGAEFEAGRRLEGAGGGPEGVFGMEDFISFEISGAVERDQFEFLKREGEDRFEAGAFFAVCVAVIEFEAEFV